jgi:hypothetical protein
MAADAHIHVQLARGDMHLAIYVGHFIVGAVIHHGNDRETMNDDLEASRGCNRNAAVIELEPVSLKFGDGFWLQQDRSADKSRRTSGVTRDRRTSTAGLIYSVAALNNFHELSRASSPQ